MLKKSIKRLLIRRSQWGEGFLKRRDNGKMCCLGFMCKRLGVSDEVLEGRYWPFSAIEAEGCIGHPMESLDFYGAAVKINDDKSIPRKQKEIELKKLFKENGIRLDFKD